MPSNFAAAPPSSAPPPPRRASRKIEDIVPADENKPFDMMAVIAEIVDEGSWLEIKPLFAREILTGFATIDGRVVGIVANQPKWLGGVLFVDSADKAARFIWLCDAFSVPLLFLADVPGFMIGTKVERQGIIRAGAKMIAAVSEATVTKICVVIRKAYGAGLYAMCGPAFEPDSCIALPSASIAVMGPQAAVNAVYYNKIQETPEGPERDALVATLREAYRADIDILHLASEMVVDAVVPGDALRGAIAARFARAAAASSEPLTRKKHVVSPV
jgi:acetyl-CoA carboxylase carboxyltransferase component